ncbi:hypothetical protein [Janthinobacterium sp.]|uniref:hypothetical protein n=1 Tax=Janthinobacterium sp. TaxID=1871054 RepID=UPI0025B9C9B4|nr:hypothetical protein [Janthinobacterium sp.]
MKNLFSVTALTFLLLSNAALAQSDKDCSAIVKSPQDAADRADWVIDADVVDVVRMHSDPALHVSIENATVQYELERSPRFFSAMLTADACLSPGAIPMQGKAAASRFVGKRMRFYGTKLAAGGGRRFFFVQAVEPAMPAIAAVRKEYTDKQQMPIAAPFDAQGWTRARSADGGFSVDMPGPFSDMTQGSAGRAGFMLRGTDRHGTLFMAVFERSGPGSGMGATFDEAYSKPNAKVTKFKGADAVITLGTLPESNGAKITHGLWFRVPGGTYMLSVIADKEQDAQSLASRQRFFHSLAFE